MTILSGQTIRRLRILEPCREQYQEATFSGGLGPAGYDLALDIGNDTLLRRVAPGEFLLVAAKECFSMPDNVVGVVHDKSSWARRGLTVQNTIIEPGWFGHLTLELTNHSDTEIVLFQGWPIAQVVFHYTDERVERPYRGKYQGQAPGPQWPR